MSVWILVVALVIGALQQGGFYGAQFQLLLLVVFIGVLTTAAGGARRAVDWRTLIVVGAVAGLSVGLSVVTGGADLGSAGPTVALVLGVLAAMAIGSGSTDRAAERFSDGVVACGLVVSVTAWAGVGLHREPWALAVDGLWRGSSTLTYANATGALAGVGLVLALARLRSERGFGAFIPAYLLAVGVLCSGSRAGWLGVAVGVAVLAARCGWRPVLGAGVPVAAAASVAVLGLLPGLSVGSEPRPLIAGTTAVIGLVVGWGMQQAGSRRWVWLLGPLLIGVLVVMLAPRPWEQLRGSRFDLDSDARRDEWTAAVEEFESAPVFGVGPGMLNLSWETDDGRLLYAEFVHNEYLELLATQGIVGIAALATAAGIVVTRVRSLSRRSVVDDAAIAALAVFAVHSAFDFLWHIPVLPIAAAGLIGVLLRPLSPSTSPPIEVEAREPVLLREGSVPL